MPSCAHDNRCSRRGPAVLASIAALAAMLAVPLSAVAAPRDRDHDHLSDRYEVKHSHTNPRLPDTDGDRLRDGFEVRHSRTNPRKKDTDGDGLTDGYELKHVNTSPRRTDTDRDGASDRTELLLGTDPLTKGKKKPPRPTSDLLPPETQINSGPSGTVTTGDASFTFAASDTGSTFQCRVDAGTWASCSSPKAYSGLANGWHTFDVRATDAAGNTDASPATRTWTVAVPPPPDTTAPDTTISGGPSGIVTTGNASFTFSSSETGSTFECRIDAGSWGSCSSSKAYSGLADGSHTFDVRATDTAGNTDASPASRTWAVAAAAPPDTTPPDTTVTGGPSGSVTTGNASLTFTSSETGSTFACRIDAGAWASCTSPKAYSGLADGSHTFEVRATDPAGNTDTSPASRTWSVAVPPTPAAPTASFTWSPQNPQDPPATVTFTSTGTCPATPCTYEWRHGPPGNEPIGTGQTASWTFQSTGAKTVVLRVTDSLGRFAEATNTITVSNSAPPPPPPDADGDGVPDASDQCPGTPAGTPVDATGCPTSTPPPTNGPFPDASNTGVPAGTVLTPSGGLTITTAGAVINAREITGQVVVNAPNVTIRNSRIRSNSMWVVDNSSTRVGDRGQRDHEPAGGGPEQLPQRDRRRQLHGAPHGADGV